MENTELIFAFSAILGGLIQLALIVAAIILFYKNKNAGTILMLLGSILMLINLFAGIVLPILFARKGAEYLAKSVTVQQVLGQIPFMVYVVGALIYAIGIPKKK